MAASRISARTRRALFGTAAAILTASSLAAPFAAFARPIVPAERRYDAYAGALPTCADAGVVDHIRSAFHDRETEFWKSGLDIQNLGDVRETGFRPDGLDHIPRRYCQAQVYMNNQSVRSVSYFIVEDAGLAGFGYDVEWCVDGLDRNNAYGGDCHDAQP